MDLFSSLEEKNKQIPLAEILRPETLEDFMGQANIIAENTAVYNLLKSKRLFSLILWGPPGCGKTTLARIITKTCDADFIELSAVMSGVKDIKDAVDKAKENLRYGKKTILFIDEIHRYSKTQQDALLPHLENGTLYLIGSTTENPSFQVIPALLSRVQTLILKPLEHEHIKKLVHKGFEYLAKTYGEISVSEQIFEMIAAFSGGDARYSLNLTENAYFAANIENGKKVLLPELVENLAQNKQVRYSRQEHYDCASAFQKSLRGSDPDAAVYYLAKMIAGGEDPRFIARRLIVTAAEDVGNANPNALNVAVSAYKAVELLGLPEGRIPLAMAVEYVARSKKTNRACVAIDKALADIQSGLDYPPPMHLRDAHYKDAEKYGFGVGYKYSHDHPNEYQQFLPDELKNKKYFNYEN